jgi:hypothetical protein
VKPPLLRPGENALDAYQRVTNERLKQERAVAKIVLALDLDAPKVPFGLASARELRGIPAVAKGSPGAVRGTRPDHEIEQRLNGS